MDTGSHLLFGVTLAGLAQLDPVVSQSPALQHALLIGVVLGSNAPDFDGLMRLKGYSWYLRHHRGITHSLPALLIWPALLSPLMALSFGVWNHFPLLFLWMFISVAFHVFLDMLNSYGVQCARPVTKDWVHLDILAIFEPFLFAIHALGASVWLVTGNAPALLLAWIYAATFGYIAVRAIQHWSLLLKLRDALDRQGVYHVLPGFHWFRWTFVAEGEENFYTGKIDFGIVSVQEVLSKAEQDRIIQATMGTDGVRAFLSFSQRIHVTYQELNDGYEVKWSDVRFWHNRKLPFGVDVRLDRNLNVVGSNLGWRKRAWEPPFV